MNFQDDDLKKSKKPNVKIFIATCFDTGYFLGGIGAGIRGAATGV